VKYRILPDAQQDLREIDNWVAENFGHDFAIETETSIYKAFDLLAQYPNLGHTRRDVESRPVRFYFIDPYWIIHQPDIPLLIHRVFHGARDPRTAFS